MKKNLLTLVFAFISYGFLSAQTNYTMQEAAQLYIDGIVYNNTDALKKLNEYVKPVFSKEEIAAGNLVPRPSLEEFANQETNNFVGALEKEKEADLKPSMYKYFLEEGKAVQGSKCVIKNVTITDEGRKSKTAKVDFTCEMKSINFEVEPDITEKSSGKEIAAYYDVLTKRFQTGTARKTANLSFEMTGKVIKGSNEVVWYLPMPIFINQVINMELTNSEVK